MSGDDLRPLGLRGLVADLREVGQAGLSELRLAAGLKVNEAVVDPEAQSTPGQVGFDDREERPVLPAAAWRS